MSQYNVVCGGENNSCTAADGHVGGGQSSRGLSKCPRPGKQPHGGM